MCIMNARVSLLHVLLSPCFCLMIIDMVSFSLFSVISAGKTNLYSLSQWYDHMRICLYILYSYMLITDDYKIVYDMVDL